MILKIDYFQLCFLYKRDQGHFYWREIYKNYQSSTLLNPDKPQYLPIIEQIKVFQGIVVNQALPSLHEIGGSLEITRTVPLIVSCFRRMPATFRVGLPSAEQRRSILTTVLRMEVISDCVDTWRLAKLTEGFSGSDLRELCRSAAVCRVYQLKEDQEKLDPINMEDLLTALAKMRESKIECGGSIPRPPDLD